MDVEDSSNNPKSASDVVKTSRSVREWLKAYRLSDRGFTRTLEVLITIATLVSATVAYVQWKAMEHSNKLTRESNELTRESNQLTREAMAQAQRQFDIAQQEAREQSIASAKEAEAQRTQSEAYNRATLEMARKSFEASQQSFEEAQRAQLVVESSSFTFHEDGTPIGGSVTVRNAGRSPATDVRWAVCLASGTTGGSVELKAAMPVIDRWWLSQQRDVIGPGATRVLLESGLPNFWCPRKYQANPNDLIFLIGRVQYLDGFGRERFVDACKFWAPRPLTPSTRNPGLNPRVEYPCVGFSEDGLVDDLVARKKYEAAAETEAESETASNKPD